MRMPSKVDQHLAVLSGQIVVVPGFLVCLCKLRFLGCINTWLYCTVWPDLVCLCKLRCLAFTCISLTALKSFTL